MRLPNYMRFCLFSLSAGAIAVMRWITRFISHPIGALAVLALAAFLEAFGDSLFQTSFYRASGTGRVLALIAGAAVLTAYGATVNAPRWDFGRLIGVYVALFFVIAQVLNKIRFGQSPTLPVYVGGAFVIGGGLLMAFW